MVAFDEIIDRYLYKIARFVGIDAGPFKADYERVFIDSDCHCTGRTFCGHVR